MKATITYRKNGVGVIVTTRVLTTDRPDDPSVSVPELTYGGIWKEYHPSAEEAETATENWLDRLRTHLAEYRTRRVPVDRTVENL